MNLLNVNGTTIDLEQLEIVHYIPGRVRFRTNQLKRNGKMGKSVLKSVSDFDFIKECKINTTTGSILLIFDPPDEKQIQAWITQIAASGLLPEGMSPEAVLMFMSRNSEDDPHSLSQEIRTFFSSMNKRFRKSTGGVAGLNDVFPLMLLFLGFRRLVTSKRLAFPEWYTYMWFSFTAYFILNPSQDNSESDYGKS